MAEQRADDNGSGHADNTVELPVPAIPASESGAGAQTDDDQMSLALSAFWESVKRLPSYIRLATAMARDPEVPKQAKAVLGVGGGYAVSPIDLVPGIIPVAGQLDDLYVILTALQQAVKMTPAQVADRHLAEASIRREDIDADLKAVRDLVRIAVTKSLIFGGKTLGRLSRAATSFANRQLKRRDARRTEKPL
jgi:uncharacterized membrane protein YkvA (DUF1232 family)